MKRDTHKQAWELWLKRLSPEVRSSLSTTAPPPLRRGDDRTADYQLWRSQLSPAAREQVDQHVSMPVEEEAQRDPERLRYAMVECLSGEFPVLKIFKTAESLAKRIGELEGEDVAVWPFYGVPLAVTRGPQRYLALPDQQTCLSIPLFKGGPMKRVDAGLLQADLQEDGFLGPEELAVSPSRPEDTASPAQLAAADEDNPDDEGEADADAGVPVD